MCLITSLPERRAELRTSFRKHNLLIQNHCIAGEMCRLFLNYFDSITYVIANCPLSVFIKCRRMPDRVPIRQRTKARVQVIKPVLDQFHRDNQRLQLLPDNLVRSNIRAKSIATKQHIPAKKRISLALKEQLLRQPHNLITPVRKPFLKMLLLSLSLRKAKIASNKLFAN